MESVCKWLSSWKMVFLGRAVRGALSHVSRLSGSDNETNFIHMYRRNQKAIANGSLTVIG